MSALALEETLGHSFAETALIEEALTHRSFQPRGGRRRPVRPKGRSYERLEFLGDRVLGLIVAEMLLDHFPNEVEGELARRHAELVRKETLASVAAELDLPRHIRLPAIEEKDARSNPSLLADVCEAVIAALYLDGGLETVRRVVVQYWTPRMTAAAVAPKDPKTALQEWAQARALKPPTYRLVLTEGPPHQPVFTVAVEVSGHTEETASGASKRLAEAAAAAALLQRLTLEAVR